MAPLALMTGAITSAATALVAHRRRRLVAVVDQPAIPPRSLSLVDSWQAVVSQLGEDDVRVRQRLYQQVTTGLADGITAGKEIYGYRTPNGYEERERLVLTRGQASVHVHIYRFGSELFVGWQAFLNWAKWAETVPVSVKADTRQEIEYRQLTPFSYVPNQFDLIDLNALSELVHRRLEMAIKAILKERAIEQEIDFRIIRGDRDRALSSSQHKSGQQDKAAAAKTGWGSAASGGH